jgi:pyruvate,orthophosphate dikinase
MLRMGAWLGRKTKPDIKLGVCGEHGGDPDSIDFLHHSGIDYVSCSPYRVPVARVAAAQAAVRAASLRQSLSRSPKSRQKISRCCAGPL